MNFDDFKTLCEQRHSVRVFDMKAVREEQILELIEVARLAPNIENRQPWHFHIIEPGLLRTQLLATCCYGNFYEQFGAFIIVTAKRYPETHDYRPIWNPAELEYSCVAAMQNMIMGATAMGLGSTWVSLHRGTSHDLLDLPDDEIIVGGVMIGHRMREDQEMPRTHDRKPVSEIMTFHE